MGVTGSGHPSTLTRFEAETSVIEVEPGLYSAFLHKSWWIVAGPNGGYIAAIVLRAMVAMVAEPDRRPRSLSIQYLRPPTEGEIRIEVTVERAGRSVSNLSARMTQDGRTVVLAMASFANDREGIVSFDETDGFADIFGTGRVPSPDEVKPGEVDPTRDVPMRGHYDIRWVVGDLPFTVGSGQEGSARCGGWLRPVEPVAIDEVVLAAMSDAWLPPIFSRVDIPLAIPTIDLTIHFRTPPKDPFGFCFVLFESPVAAHGYTVEHGRILDSDGTLLVECRQLAVLA